VIEAEEINYIELTKNIYQILSNDLKITMKPAIENVARYNGNPYSSKARVKFRTFMIFYLIHKVQTENLPKNHYGEFITQISTERLIEESKRLYNEQTLIRA